MLMPEAREAVAEYCHRLGSSSLASGTSGNVSVLDRTSGQVAISPSSMPYHLITPADVVIINELGQRVEGKHRPSTEAGMHLAAYRARADSSAVVHTHSHAATTLAVLGEPLPAVHYMIALSGASCIPLAPYHLYGSDDLAQAAADALQLSRACLLRNHGLLACGADLQAAYALAEQVEFCAELYLRAKAVGEPRILSDQQIRQVIAQLESYTPQGL